MKQAEAGIANLTDKVDSMIIIPNDRLKFVTDQKITFANAFGIADDVLKQAVSSISELVGYSENVIINLDFADVSATPAQTRVRHMGAGSATGRPDKAEQAAQAAVSSPLLETSINGATGVPHQHCRFKYDLASTTSRQLPTSAWKLPTLMRISSLAPRLTTNFRMRCA